MNIQTPLPRILIYQDDDCSVLVDYLTISGFDVINTSEKDVLEKLREGSYDLCILDHFKANTPGDLSLLYYLRKLNTKRPVLFVSALFDYSYIIEAFNSGVDDYVTKPYNLEELVCRIKALLNRCGVKARGFEQTYKIGNYTFDVETGILKSDSTELNLTAKETKILALLCAYKDELLSKEIVLHSVWKDDNYFNKRSLDVHMCHLRNYLNQDKRIKIDTVRGLGYSLTINGEEQ